MIKALITDFIDYGLSVAWFNFRFTLGYKIGGLTSATSARSRRD